MSAERSKMQWSGQLRCLHDDEGDFDLEFWQGQSSAQRMRATWDLVKHYAARKGLDLDELRLQRFVENLKRS